MRFVLVKGFPEFGVGLTPFVFTFPQAFSTALALVDTCWEASALPLAPAPVPGKNTASDAIVATANKPAGRRN
jgi:hypothetical protein